MSIERTEQFLHLVGVIVLSAVQVAAQAGTKPAEASKAAPSAPPASQKRTTTRALPSRPVIVDAASNAPQVVTLLHRLSGIKMFRLLMRSGDVKAIANVDDSFRFNGDVHTNVLAALALDDGNTVAAWLPEVDAEIGPALLPEAPNAIGASPPSGPAPGAAIVASKSIKREWGRQFESPDITVIAQDRKRVSARYVGIDGVTGLSILEVVRAPNTQRLIEAKEDSIIAGQRVHVFGPEPAPESAGSNSGPVYVRIGETEGQIKNVLHGPSGAIVRLEMQSSRISPANIGGVAINDQGETLGIVDAVKGSEATILPTALIKGAVKRVLERQASVPRPWLGIRGEPLGAFPLEQLERYGWETELARTLAAREGKGILLTSVAPGSPASRAALKPGDVILSVNEDVVRTAEDFSWVLEEAGPGGSLRFTVAKPGQITTEAIEVRLSESPDPFFNLRMPTLPVTPESSIPGAPVRVLRYALSSSLVADGIETVALRPRVAAKLGSTGGLLVVYVEPASLAFKAGLRAGDVIEAINGQQAADGRRPFINKESPGSVYTCNIVRNKQKLVLRLEAGQQ